MRFSKVLLVFPQYKGGHFGGHLPPAGLGYLAQTLADNGVEYDVVDMSVGYDTRHLFSEIEAFNPGLVAISMMSYLYYDHYELARTIKDRFPSLKIIAGGPHASTLRRQVLEDCPAIDFAVVMEGEQALWELCRGDELSQIGGLIYRENSQIIFNGERPFIKELDAIPFPRYHKFPLKEYVTEEIGIVTSRGCPGNCIFCPVTTSIGRKFRMRSAQSVVDEVEYWYKRGYRQFSILDDNFTMVKKRVIEICDGIINLGYKDVLFNCNNGVRADRVDREVLSRMWEAGFRYLAFGVEGGNNKILKNLKKGETVEEIEAAIKTALEIGFRVTLFFLVGSPGETLADVRDSIDLANKYPIFDARFYNLIPFPSSELYEQLIRENCFIQDPKYYLNRASQWSTEPVFQTPEFDAASRRKALVEVGNARKNIRFTAMKRELSRLGMLSNLMARMYVSNWVQDRLLHNPIWRRKMKNLYLKLTG